MRLIVSLAASAALLGGCIISPHGQRDGPRYPRQSSGLETIDPYRTDKIPDTPYEIWKRDKERNDKIAGTDGDTYPPLFKGQSGASDGATK